MLKIIQLKPENEPYILKAFSKRNLMKIRDFNLNKRSKLQKKTDRKLTVQDLPL